VSRPTPRPGPRRAKQLCLDSSVVCTILLQERDWQAIMAALERPEVEGVLPWAGSDGVDLGSAT
jgi:hypothetical protein